jgi:hypothetical protein
VVVNTEKSGWKWFYVGSDLSKIRILDGQGKSVAETFNAVAARRIVAGMKTLNGFTLAELENEDLISDLLSKIVILQKLLRKHVYTKDHEGTEFCRECLMFKSAGKHAEGRLCHVLNLKQ